MAVGGRNRVITWSGIGVPFKPGKDDLITSVRRAQAIFDSGGMLAIAGEGRIHVHEGDLMPLHEGTAYLALHPRAYGGLAQRLAGLGAYVQPED